MEEKKSSKEFRKVKLTKNERKNIMGNILGGTCIATILAFPIKWQYDYITTPKECNILETKVSNSTLANDEEILEYAKEFDYYDTLTNSYKSLNSAFNGLKIKDLEKAYNEKDKDNMEKITLQEFEKKVKRSFENISIINNFGETIKLSKNEINSIKEDIIEDYITIKKYAEESYEKDFDSFYKKVLSNKLKNVLKENNIETFSLNNIAVTTNEKYQKRIKFDFTVNGEEKSIITDTTITKYVLEAQDYKTTKSISNLIQSDFIYVDNYYGKDKLTTKPFIDNDAISARKQQMKSTYIALGMAFFAAIMGYSAKEIYKQGVQKKK